MDLIYFDNSATTKVYPEVAELCARIMTEEFGNPSSMHSAGVDAEKYMRRAAEQIAKTLHAKEKEILFTSGGTESNNLALFGGARARRRRGNHIITSAIEHPSVANTVKALKEEGFDVTVIGADALGQISLAELEAALRPDTILVSLMAVNNETGAATDLETAAKLIREASKEALFHVDAVQAYGKYDLFPGRTGIDLLSVSSHKFHGPKGAGFLYKKDGVKILPLLYGGGQQGGLRPGTDNVPGIAGMGLAAEMIYAHLAENREKLYGLKAYLRESLRALGKAEDGTPYAIVHGAEGESGAPHIVNAAFPGVGAEVLLHTLEDKGICISAGSACSTHKRAPSAVLTAMGLSKEEIASSVRFSFCEWNTKEEIDRTVGVLKECLPVLRRYRAR